MNERWELWNNLHPSKACIQVSLAGLEDRHTTKEEETDVRKRSLELMQV